MKKAAPSVVEEATAASPAEQPAPRAPLVSARKAVAGQKDRLVAALKLLREKKAVDSQEEHGIVKAFEAGDEGTKLIIGDLVERLEEAAFGDVAVQITEHANDQLARIFGRPLPISATPEQRRQALKDAADDALEVGEDLVEDLVRKGRRAVLQSDTRELEKVFFRWSIDTIGKVEQGFVRGLVGLGALVLVVGGLYAAYQVDWLRDYVVIAAVALFAIIGVVLMSWSGRVARWAEESRAEMEQFLSMTPSERLQKYVRQREDAEAAAARAATSTTAPPTDK